MLRVIRNWKFWSAALVGTLALTFAFWTRIDPQFQLAIIASASALFGSVIGLVGGWLNTNMQFAHDAEKTERERVFNLKKEVCLELASVAMRPLKYLRTIIDPNTPTGIAYREMEDVEKAVTKARMIAGPTTVHHLLALQKHMTAVSVDLALARFELDLKKSAYDAVAREAESLKAARAQRGLTPELEKAILAMDQQLRAAGLGFLDLQIKPVRTRVK